jgi:metal-responsive CopG/Arc/MetJ family transcriptional regulator
MSQTQTSVKLAPDLLQRLDERAAREGSSRSALVRSAIEVYLYDEQKVRIDREIVEGYERIPSTDEEMAFAKEDAREAVKE